MFTSSESKTSFSKRFVKKPKYCLNEVDRSFKCFPDKVLSSIEKRINSFIKKKMTNNSLEGKKNKSAEKLEKN